MNSPALKDVLDRAETWPSEDQEELIKAALYIEQRHSCEYTLTEEDWTIIAARLEAARLGGFATDEEVATVFGKYRAA